MENKQTVKDENITTSGTSNLGNSSGNSPPERQRQPDRLALTEDNLDYFLKQQLEKSDTSSSSDGSTCAHASVYNIAQYNERCADLTEENLDFFLQQEYALLDNSYDSERMSLYEFDAAQVAEQLGDTEGGSTEDAEMEEVTAARKREHLMKPNYCPPGNELIDDNLISKSFKELFKTGFSPEVYYEIFTASQPSRPPPTFQPETELVVPVPPLSEVMPNIIEGHPDLFGPSSNEEIAETEVKMETTDVSNVRKNSVKNINSNSYSKDIVATSNKIENIQISHQNNGNFDTLVTNALKGKIPLSSIMSGKMCQSLNISINHSSRKLTGLNEILDNEASQEKNIVHMNQDLFSVRDLALASTSDDIKFIDTDEDCLESAICHIAYHKTDCDDSKVFKTLFNRSLSVQDISRVFVDSSSLFFYDKIFEGVVPSKSNLKRKSEQVNSKKNKLKKAGLKFTNVTIFYFERSQGFTSVPSKGGSTLGMESHHFYITTIPIDEYERKKIKKELSRLRINHIIYRRRCDIRDKPKNVQALGITQRIQLLESSDIQIELKEEDDCAYIRSSRAAAGCDCKDYCDPEICSCNLAGIECQVDRPNFPCGCTYDNCKNSMGRNEYNHNSVKTHFVKTMRKIKSENKTRASRRKQTSPTKILNNNSDIIGNVIHI